MEKNREVDHDKHFSNEGIKKFFDKGRVETTMDYTFSLIFTLSVVAFEPSILGLGV
jgi:hypothetical protein